MNDKIVQALLDYLEHYSNPPELDWPEHWFEEVSFSRWAVCEMLNAVLDHPITPAADTIAEFELKMEVYEALSGERPSGRIFSIAAQTAREFLEMI